LNQQVNFLSCTLRVISDIQLLWGRMKSTAIINGLMVVIALTNRIVYDCVRAGS
jgi:hypothetical protein